MNIEDLEESLADFLPEGFKIEVNKKGEVVIFSGLKQDPKTGELSSFDEDSDSDNEEFEEPEDLETVGDEYFESEDDE